MFKINEMDCFKDTTKKDINNMVKKLVDLALKKDIQILVTPNIDDSDYWVLVRFGDVYSFDEGEVVGISTHFTLDFSKKQVNKLIQKLKEEK